MGALGIAQEVLVLLGKLDVLLLESGLVKPEAAAGVRELKDDILIVLGNLVPEMQVPKLADLSLARARAAVETEMSAWERVHGQSLEQPHACSETNHS